jgi:hypothetical protein
MHNIAKNPAFISETGEGRTDGKSVLPPWFIVENHGVHPLMAMDCTFSDYCMFGKVSATKLIAVNEPNSLLSS